MVDILITYFTLLLTNICIVFFAKRILNVKIKSKKRLMLFSAFFSIFSLLNAFNPSATLKNIVSLIIEFLLINLTIKEDINKKLLTTIIIWSITIIFDFAFSIFIVNFITNSYPQFISMYRLQMIVLTGILMLMVGIFINLPFVKYFLFRVVEIVSKIKFLYMYIATSIVFFIAITTTTILYVNVSNSQFLLLIILIVFLVLIVFLLKVLVKFELLSSSNTELLRRNASYSKVITDYKEFKHNYRHKLMAIKNIGDKKVKELVDIQLKETDNNIRCIEGAESLPESIKGIVWEKICMVDTSKVNIKFVNNLDKDFIAEMSMKKYNDLCIALGICLDNAIEAAVTTANPEIMLDLSNIGENVKISLFNNFANILDIDKFGDKEYSTKNRDSGYGVYTLAKLKSVKIKNKIYNDLFETVITI